MSKINQKAAEFKDLRKKQALANRYIKEQRLELGKSHRFFKSAMNRVKDFQRKHGLKVQSRFSMKDLEETDVEMYEQLLDSIIESTYMNPETYKNFKESQLDYAISQGWAKDREDAELIYEFANSDIVEDLKDKASIDIPSKIVEKYAKYMDSQMTKEDFEDMAKSFMKLYSSGDIGTSEFFNYADAYKELSDINKVQRNYGILSDTDAIMKDAVDSGIVNSFGTNDFEKAINEYKEQIQLDKEGRVLSFIDYFKDYYF